MPIQIIQIEFDDLNFSLQVGDIVYYSPATASSSGFTTASHHNSRMLGPVEGIDNNRITFRYDDQNGSLPLLDNGFYSFSKDKIVNTSNLVGYYADVNFVNNSTEKAELFSVSSEINESSK
tara:strand:+ start:8945 stop:9307 length:363 start_codon:yes stop_codon:yes gene_type:complete